MTNNPDTPADFDVHSEYKIDAGFIISYVILFAGFLVFDWDPRYVFLGLGIELLIAIIGYQAQSFIAASGRALAIALILNIPAIFIALGYLAYPLASLIQEGVGDRWAALGLIAFVIGSLYSNYQRFCKTSLRVARFYRYLNQKYIYENGKPVLGGASLIMGSLTGTWLAIITFFICFGISLFAGPYSHASAIVMTICCLLRQLATIGIVRLAYRKNRRLESLWISNFEKIGKVTLREP